MYRALTNAERSRVVQEAKSWLQTPYHHLADVKGYGVDCAMLLVRVYTDLGFAPKFDPRPYAAQWYLHRSEEKYLEWVKKYCVQISGDGEPGDILMFRFGRCASHGAIVVDRDYMIHAYAISNKVQIRERWAPLQHGTFDSIWSVRVQA